MDNFKTINEFIDRAVKNRNYAPNTAYGFKGALKLFEAVAHDDEKSSMQAFEDRFEKIYEEVCRRNMSKISAASLEVYKIRVEKVLKDYKAYGENPAKMASWSSKAMIRGPKKTSSSLPKKDVATPAVVNEQAELTPPAILPAGMEPAVLPLRPGARVLLYMPAERTADDVKKIKQFVNLILGE